MLEVQIVSCSVGTYWYKDHIDEIFKIEDKKMYTEQTGEYYIIIEDEYRYKNRIILVKDCILCGMKQKIERIVAKIESK